MNSFNITQQGANTLNTTPFSSSSKMTRSPIMTPRRTLIANAATEEVLSVTPHLTDEENNARHTQTPAENLLQTSPRQEYIVKMRISEEETLAKCQDVLRKIRLAIEKQKNISMDVKKGVSELEELLDVTGDYRRNWKTAEKERATETATRKGSIRTSISGNPASITRSKRNATSPPETRGEKKQRDNSQERTGSSALQLPLKEQHKGKMTMEKTRKNAPRGRKPNVIPRERSDAVIIRPADGHSYADVLKNLRNNIKPEEADVAIRSIRKTKTGAVLLELGKGGKKDDFFNNIKEVLRDTADVKDSKPKVTIEIRDLDSFTTTDEVLAAVREATDSEDEIIVRLTDTDKREQRRAFVSLSAADAKKLLVTQRIKIGWTNCRIRYREDVKRCFRCFGSGHMQWNCDGPDRKGEGLCIRCGEKGHKIKECKNLPKCCICSQDGNKNADHLPGSRSCKTMSSWRK